MGAARLAQSRIEGERSAARLVSDMRPDLAYPPEVFERSQRANVKGQRRAMNERGDNMPKPIGSQPGEAPAEFPTEQPPGRKKPVSDSSGFFDFGARPNDWASWKAVPPNEDSPPYLVSTAATFSI